MARPFYPQEADDPDLDWLISNFLYERPNYFPVEVGSLPLVLIPYKELGTPVHETGMEEDVEEQHGDSNRKETV